MISFHVVTGALVAHVKQNSYFGTMQKNWQQQSISVLENQNFGDPATAPTPLIKRCTELCRIPLEQFSPGDLRLMIGQGFALQYLVTLAMPHLEADLFLETDFYPGDLLSNVLNVPAAFWQQRPDLWHTVAKLLEGQEAALVENGINAKLFMLHGINLPPQ